MNLSTIANKRKGLLSEQEWMDIIDNFSANITNWDCGKKCAPLNNGMGPVCCDTNHAVPVGEKSEFEALMKRTDLWHIYKGNPKDVKELKKDMTSRCGLYECKGAASCERNNRSFCCRTFPFYPFFDKKKNLIGLTIYWEFRDRCWLMSNLHLINQEFIDQFIASYNFLFEKDEDERETYYEQSITMRRTYSQLKLKIPLVTLDNKLAEYDPSTGNLKYIAKPVKYEPFRNLKEYTKAVKEAEGIMPANGLNPE